ncbi:DUF4175 family protein [Siphonobacter curvatus]|uniref:DUF4175 family protein n=1 Tax=Siphonobacter curvatus TaxID=2094562 RepID=UPI001A9C63C6|nr:DUF4175 family protein [Siphonobacter curvatus]
MQHSSITTLLVQLDEYKRKYYTNLLLKGVIFSAAVVLSAYLFLNTLEYFGHFGTTFRTLLFFGFLGVFLFSLVFWVIKPIVYLYGKQKPLSNEEAAQQIGRFFPEVGDRLLNTLQLVSLNPNQNELLRASIEQKSQQLAFVKFADAVKLNENKRYLKFVLVPALVIAGILLVWPQFFTKSTTRIVHFTNEYAEEAPFTFVLENKNLKAFKNEDYTVKLNLQGEAIPEGVYLTFEGRRFKMETTDQRHYEYTFRKVQQDISFTFEAAGYSSPTYEVDIIARPKLTGFEVQLHYPSYLNKPDEVVKNTGNLTVPEGTQIEWQFAATETEAVELSFEGDQEKSTAEKSMLSGFTFEKWAKRSGEYQVFLKNKYATNREPVSFFLNVIPDKYPTISLEQYRDSTLYNYLVLGGNIGDDYGVSNLRLFYKVVREGGKDQKAYASVGIPFSKGQTIQSFYYQWSTDSLRLAPGDKIEYFVQVWDNDGVNGAKSAKTGVLNYSIPSKRSIEKEIDQAVEKTESQIDKSLSKAQQLRKELAALETRLRNKRDLDFQDKKQIEELLKKKEELQNELRQLQELNQSLTQKQQRFNEQKPELAQKFEQLQKLMNELLKSDTDKLYEQLKQMLEKNQDERMLDMLDRLKAKERNSEKDLDRAMQLFKRLQREQKLDKSIEELKKLAENQEKLAQETEKAKDQKDQKDAVSQDQKNKNDKNGKNESDSLKNQNSKENPSDQKNKSDQNSKDQSTKDQSGKDQNKSGENSLQQEQEKLKEEMEDVKKELKDVEELNKELKEEEKDMGKQEQQEISEQQQQSMQDMKSGNNKSSSQRQKKAAQQMKSLAQKLSEMKQEAEMKENQENMDDLRDILENLVHLSFAQERVMKDFRGIQLADPRFVKLAQEQIKLQEDAKIVEDSLYSLAKRVLQIQSFVTREVGDMKKNMDDAAKSIRERRVSQATARQQFAMTNMNNLALMLSDVLKQMQENAMNMMAMGKGKPQKQKSSMPSMGKQQEQMNQQMQQTQQGNKSGKAFSEQLAQMAAQQAAIRKQLQEAMEKLKGTEAGKKLQGEVNDLMKKMDQTEEDLVNKRITPNTINRNKDILTRLLESEKAIREQEEDEKRKSETAKPVPPKVPPAFEQYVKEKQKQTELLRTVPPSLAPFYKKEVDNYFKKLK